MFIVALIFPISIPSKISIYNYIDISNIKEVEKESLNNILKLETGVHSKSSQKMISEIKHEVDDTNIDILGKYFKVIITDIWFAVCIIKLIGVICSYRNLVSKIGNNEVRDERIIKILEQCKNKLKINKNIRIIKQDFVKMPSIVGLFDIRILFTDDILKMDNTSINDVLMHELSHYKRRDNLLNMFIIIAKSVYWFNPLIKTICKFVKKDVEIATDEMAISRMESYDKREYCKVIVKIASIGSSKTEQVLGLANDIKEIEQRIDMIAIKDKFEKHSKSILLSTITIILLIGLVLYPTSYGMMNIPKLYLKLESGDKIEVRAIEENSDFYDNTIKLGKDEMINLVIEDGKCEDYILYYIINLDSGVSEENIAKISSSQLAFKEIGEYIYKFTINYGKNKSIDYAVKIVVQ